MAEIRETDLMIMCVEACKNLVRAYSMEVNDALGRITLAMSSGEKVTIARMKDDPVEKDVAARMSMTTVGLVADLERKLQ